jgi:restriction system protein
MTTRRQRQASRRNLTKARAVRSRQARRRSKQMSRSDRKVAAVIVALVVAFLMIDATHGLILIPVAAAIGGYVWLRLHRKRAADRQHEEWLAAVVRQEEQERTERLVQAQHLGALLAATPTEFEHIVAELLSALGFTILSAGGGAGDLQADIVCTHPEGHRVVVQCKRYAPGNKVSSPAMQSFVGMAHRHHAARGIYVTTSSYTRAAADLAQQQGIDLYDGERLVALARWVQDRVGASQ